jgi:hypothetical protein
MQRVLVLALGLVGAGIVVAGCDDRRPAAPAPTAEQITVDPNDVARLRMRFGDRLGEELGAPARPVAAGRAVDKAALHRQLAPKDPGRLLSTTPPVLPPRTAPLVRGGAR